MIFDRYSSIVTPFVIGSGTPFLTTRASLLTVQTLDCRSTRLEAGGTLEPSAEVGKDGNGGCGTGGGGFDGFHDTLPDTLKLLGTVTILLAVRCGSVSMCSHQLIP